MLPDQLDTALGEQRQLPPGPRRFLRHCCLSSLSGSERRIHHRHRGRLAVHKLHRGHRARADHNALEQVQRRAQCMGHRRLDGVGVGETDNDAARVRRTERRQRPNNPVLHLRKALTVRETEGGRAVLHGLPLRQDRQVGDCRAGPVAEVALQQPGLVLHLQPGAGRRRLRRLAGALQRRGIQGADGQTGEPFSHPLGLGPAPVGQMQSRRPARQHHARRRRLPVAHQEQERALPPGLR